MALRASPLLWTLNPRDERAIPSARSALALMRCTQRLSGVFSSHSYDELGHAIAPALRKHTTFAAAVLRDYCQDKRGGLQDLAEWTGTDEELISDSDALEVFGEGLARGLPHFRKLFDKVDASLQRFIERNSWSQQANIDMLARLTQLTAAETKLVSLATACSSGAVSRSLFSFINTPSRSVRALETLLDVQGIELTDLLSKQSRLARCGLLKSLTVDRVDTDMDDLLCLSRMGQRLLATPFESEHAMASAVLKPLPSSNAGVLTWPHLEQQRRVIESALRNALTTGTRGINILLYGGPGTGKTEFARQLLANIGCQGYVVGDTEDGGEASRTERLANLQLNQVFAGRIDHAAIVLDEAEDVFQSDYNNPFAKLFGASHEGKAWMNGLLENNRVPVIWISNRITQIDPAHLRRFIYCLQFPAAPYSLRREIATTRLKPLGCSQIIIDYASALPEVTPAHLDAAARFVCLVSPSGDDADAAVRMAIDAQLKAMGGGVQEAHSVKLTRFDTRYLNVRGDIAPEAVMKFLERLAQDAGELSHGTAIVFSGPPGTGKTQLAAEMAQRMGRRLVVRTASDINSKWHGESEGNVARMFKECDPASELLFLDEAEVLLGSRAGGESRPDRAVTAEFLRWLEQFNGVFVCATNHVSDFDSALMRRFTFRLEFLPLLDRQRIELYAEMVHGWSPGLGDAAEMVDHQTQRRLGDLSGLTPGDFANAIRRIQALQLPISALMNELQAEQTCKPGHQTQRMGFTR